MMEAFCVLSEPEITDFRKPTEINGFELKVWVFGELQGVDSARGVAAIVLCRRNSSCNSSCDAIPRNGRRTIALFLLFRVQSFICNRLCEGMFQHVSSVVAAARYCSLTPCRFHPFFKHPKIDGLTGARHKVGDKKKASII